jgi:hypothetical protein
MRAVHRLRFEPATHATDQPTPIDRYLGREDHAIHGRWAPAPTTGLGDIELALRDTGGPTSEIESRDDAATIWHVLWVRNETASRVSVGDATWAIAPGDSMLVPPGATRRLEGRQLAFEIAVPGAEAPTEPPTHGEDHFVGYNRKTTCCRAGQLRLCRWKLTQPLALAAHHPAPTLVLALARNSIIRTTTEIDHLVQGDLALIDPAADPIVTPDGLSYLLTIDRDPQAR